MLRGSLRPRTMHFSKMVSIKNCLPLFSLATIFSGITASGSKYRPEAYVCRLLNTKFVDSQPWLEYPIIFMPITRGRLTIWSGISSLPGSEFKCWAGKNGTGAILLDFSNFSDKLEWTYYDKNHGVTSHGISVNHRENIVYRIQVDALQTNNYLDCNKIEKIQLSNPSDAEVPNIRTTCRDCKDSTIALVNSQISELLKGKLNDHILDGLYWHLTQLISSQHFSGPISLGDFN